MKRLITLWLIINMLLVGCTQKKETIMTRIETKPEIYIITDIHYLSKSLYEEDSKTFQQLLDTNDGKLIECMPEIMNAFVEKVIEEKPSAVLVLGDITFNGERVSLYEMKEYFDQIQSAGIPVLVTTGNHDIDYPYAQSYLLDDVRYTENISEKEFRDTMGVFGLDLSLMSDSESFSYLYALQDDLYVLSLDANTVEHPCEIGDTTISWIKEALERAKEDGANVICMTHQNVLRQSDFLYVGFQLNNGDEIADIFHQYGVRYVLSGHSHLQHTSEEGNLVDICNESFALYPLSYGVLDISSSYGAYEYERVSMNMYVDEARERFDERTYRQVIEMLQENNVPSSIQNEMATFASLFNRYVFTGEPYVADDLLSDARWTYWQMYGSETFWYEYMRTTLLSE